MRLVRPLHDFLSVQVDPSRSEEYVKKTLETRERRFLELMRTRVYESQSSPYLKLLSHAGCAFSDLEAQVRRWGLERTLTALAEEGVYLSANEFKGKEEVKRGSLSFRVSPEDFERGTSSPGEIRVHSSGTAGPPSLAHARLDSLAVQAYATAIFLSAHDLFSCFHAVYDAILPHGTSSVTWLLTFAKLGIATDRWFARVIPSEGRSKVANDYFTTYLLVLMGKLFGPGFPKPESIDIREISRIVHWASEKSRRGENCCITSTASNAARIARVADDLGISLANTKFIAGAEPVTDAKREVIERVGAQVIPRYSFVTGGVVGRGCANPLHTDEVHVVEHMVAMINHPSTITGGVAIHPLLFTSINPLTSHLLLNVANGDYAAMDRRDCGCALQRAGLTLHLHEIRSYEKLTSEGMNYFSADLFDLFEKELPTEFGGGPGDYQLVEEEDGDARTRLTVVVHPDLGMLDEKALLLKVRARLDKGVHTRFWADAETFRVKRKPPHATARGKVLPLHIARRVEDSEAD